MSYGTLKTNSFTHATELTLRRLVPYHQDKVLSSKSPTRRTRGGAQGSEEEKLTEELTSTGDKKTDDYISFLRARIIARGGNPETFIQQVKKMTKLLEPPKDELPKDLMIFEEIVIPMRQTLAVA